MSVFTTGIIKTAKKYTEQNKPILFLSRMHWTFSGITRTWRYISKDRFKVFL